MADRTIKTYKTKRSSFFKVLFLFPILFLYIFEFTTDQWGLPSAVTSRRIAVFVALFFCIGAFLFGNKRIRIPIEKHLPLVYLKRFFFINCFLLFYALLLQFDIGGTGDWISNSIVRLMMFGIFPVLIFSSIFDDLDDFMSAILIAIFFQAIIICFCIANEEFSETIDRVFSNEGSKVYIEGHRQYYAGGIACITAPGLFKFSMGIIACVYKIMKTKKFFYFIVYFFLSLVGTMVARTGIFVAATGFAVIILFFLSEKNVKYVLILFLYILLVGLIAFVIIDSFDLWDFISERLTRFEKLNNGLKEGFLDDYFQGSDNTYPPLDWRTIVGIGLIDGTSANGVKIYADGGFIRLFAAFGLPLCVLFYLFFFFMVLRLAFSAKRKTVKYSLLFFVLVLMMGEFKEYTIYKEYMVCIFFTISLLDCKTAKQLSQYRK